MVRFMLQGPRRRCTIFCFARIHDAILAPFWPQPRSDECHFLSLELSTLCYALMPLSGPLHQSDVAVAGATKALNTRQGEAVTVSLFFPPPQPHAINLTAPTQGILYSPQFRSHQETKMAARRTQRSTSTISRENRGL